MFKKLLLAALLGFLAFAPAEAQNPQCPDRPKGDSTNACANTRFVQNNGGGSSGGAIVVTSVAGISCNGVADDTAGFATLATQVGNGDTQIIFPVGADCRVTSWTMTAKTNVRITGPSGNNENAGGTRFAARIVCTRTDSGLCFNFANGKAIGVENLEVCYSSTAFTGILWSFSHTATTGADNWMKNVTLHRCINSTNAAGIQLLYLGNNAGVYLDNVVFEHASFGILGAANGETKDTTNVRCYNCRFQTIASAAVLNPGSFWSFTGTWFHGDLVSAVNGILNSNTTAVVGLSIVSSIFSDGSATGTWIDLAGTTTAVQGLTVTGTTFGGGANAINSRNTSGASINGNAFVSTGVAFLVSGTCTGVFGGGNSVEVTSAGLSGTCTNSLWGPNSGAGAATSNIASLTGTFSLTTTNANAVNIGRQGATDPAFKIDTSSGTGVTGIQITSAASGSRALLAAISNAGNEGLSIDAKGSGTIRLNATGTGAIEFSRNAVPTANDGAALGTTALGWSDAFFATGGVINWGNGNCLQTHAAAQLTFNCGATSTYTFATGITTFNTPAAGSIAAFLLNASVAGTAVGMTFQDGGTTKWVFKKETDNSFHIQDFAAARTSIHFTTGTALTGRSLFGQPFGYSTGIAIGGTITQITSRTTGVTLNAGCGAITLVSAAGSGTAASFTVTNSVVAAVDTIILNQKSGTDKYDLAVTAIGAGSFEITSRTYAGTTSEQPVFQFCVLKGTNN